MTLLRNEYKYIISNEQKNFLLALWSPHLIADPHTNSKGKTPILSLYYDSPNLDFYYEKLDGIHTRNKIRLRTYDFGFIEGNLIVLEIKQRFGDRIRKIRVFEKNFANNLFNLNNWIFSTPQERDSFNNLIFRYNPKATAQVFYIRDAYLEDINPTTRVTFDTTLMGYHPEETVTKDSLLNSDRRLMPDDMAILEIKNNSPELPKWALQGIRQLGLVQKSIPKYISAIEKLGIDQNRLNAGEFI